MLVITAFHFIRPELNPLTSVVSEYAVGTMGWLLNAALVGFAVGVASLGLAFARELQPPASSQVGGVLLTVSALGILSSGLFNTEPRGADQTLAGRIHFLSGLQWLLCMISAMIVLSRRLNLANRLRDGYQMLQPLSWLAAFLFLFLASFFVFGEMHGLPGLGQRLFLAVMFAWLLTAAQGIRSDKFARQDSPAG